MTRHLLRLIWNRKRQNFLLTVEIFFSFLALFGVVLIGAQLAYNSRLPIGFSIDRVWNVSVDRKEDDNDPAVKARHRETYTQLLAALRDLPQIEAVSASYTGPYTNSSWGTGSDLADGRKVRYGLNKVTDSFQEVFQIPVAEGRWFSREDDGSNTLPVVLNRRLAREIFGDGRAVGQIIPEAAPKEPPSELGGKPEVKRVVGIVDEFRQHGELATADSYMLQRMRIDGADPKAGLPYQIFVRVAPGTPASFEEVLVKRAMAVAGNWSFEVETLDAMRTSKLRQYTAPLMVVGTIAGFLLLMVGLGLTGVVWQSVTQRIREFGLRRAKGATIPNVRAQVLTEIVLMTTLAVTAAVLLIAQLPLLPLPEDARLVSPVVFVASIAISVVAIYLLTLACGWQPSRLATRIQPAEALHYE
jgi:putative ABC transport system permease protein